MLKRTILLSFFYSFSVFSTDPLLKRSWIPSAREFEDVSFHSLQKIVNKNQTVRKDPDGRTIQVFSNGDIAVILDQNYKSVFPNIDSVRYHEREVEMLMGKRREYEAIRLGKGIQLCRDVLGLSPSNELQSMLSTLYKKNSSDEISLSLFTDPYGCRKSDRTILESSDYGYRLEIPEGYEFPFTRNDPADTGGTQQTFRYKMVYLAKRIPEEVDESFEKILDLSSRQILLREGDSRILLTIGATYSFSPIVFTKDTYAEYWDNNRGLNAFTKRNIRFKRQAVKSYYESEFVVVDKDGQAKEISMKEAYFLRGKRGLFFSASTSKKHKELLDRDWEFLVANWRIK